MIEWVAIISALGSCAVSITHVIIAYKRSKEPPKDPVWEAALRITTNQNSSMCDADQFAQTYEELKAFKDNGCSMGGYVTLHQLLKSANQSTCGLSATQQQSGEE